MISPYPSKLGKLFCLFYLINPQIFRTILHLLKSNY
nr:MAG TPA: Mitotic-spindle organizing gamma-tubulin ring associated [Caudoviricetes sp.]DAJ14608.1 MAG TPA: Mitotic-spindle organizing gamma-tubulin ring associated [Siphoviridae sp. ctdzB12]